MVLVHFLNSILKLNRHAKQHSVLNLGTLMNTDVNDRKQWIEQQVVVVVNLYLLYEEVMKGLFLLDPLLNHLLK